MFVVLLCWWVCMKCLIVWVKNSGVDDDVVQMLIVSWGMLIFLDIICIVIIYCVLLVLNFLMCFDVVVLLESMIVGCCFVMLCRIFVYVWVMV